MFIYDIAGIAPIYFYTTVNVTKPYLERHYPALGGPDIENWRINK